MTITPTNVDGLTLSVTGVDSDRIPTDSRNLVIQAALHLARHASHHHHQPRLHFHLVKSIPTQAGLGGGSADAAAALVGCNRIWNTGLSEDELKALGACIGEDVPFFIHGRLAIGTGYNQPLIPIATDQNVYQWHWVLGTLPVGLSTKAVFAHLDHLLANSSFDDATYHTLKDRCLNTAWGSTAPQLLLGDLVNGLQEPSTQLCPEIALALQAGDAAGALASLMTGSGSTCIFLAEDGFHAKHLVVELQKHHIFREVVAVVGPVDGVKVQ